MEEEIKDEEVEEELTEEELAKMDSLFGFGGCNCDHCDKGCHDEDEEEKE